MSYHSQNENRERDEYRRLDARSGVSTVKFPSSDRLRYAGQLHNLDKPLRREEMAFIAKWSGILSIDRWSEFQLSWLRGLSAYGTPPDFLGSFEVRTAAFRRLGMDWLGMTRGERSGKNHPPERTKISPYIERVSPELHPVRIARGCLLCENILQGIDSRAFPEVVPDNVMLDCGTHVVLPNRWPAVPLHMLWLKRNHDDLSTRALPSILPTDAGRITRIDAEPGKTRGNLVFASDIRELFQLCDALGLVAVRNHPLSGMSIPLHDHWHLVPLECYPRDWFDGIVRNSFQRGALRAEGTPFDVLVLRNPNREQLAEETAFVLNGLEIDAQVFSPTYVAGGSLLVAPLRREIVGNLYVPVGGMIQNHELDPSKPDTMAVADKYAPRRYEFNWQGYPMDDSKVTPAERPLTKEDIHARYRPIPYGDPTWADRAILAQSLSPLAAHVYRELLPRQDCRGDPGHTDTVLRFTLDLANLTGLNGNETEAVALAAIFHDAGWYDIPDIRKRWQRLADHLHRGVDAERKVAQVEMLELRVLHQKNAVRLMPQLIGDHPRFQEIAAVVGDHDTRFRVPPPIYRAFLDADWLARVTKVGADSDSFGSVDPADAQAVYKLLRRQFAPHDFTIPAAFYIARLEFTNTILTIAEARHWDVSSIPKEFEEEFAEELRLLRAM